VMITKPFLICLLTSLLLSSGCAARNRWLSRKDYSEMQDPFMQSDAVASTERSPDRAADSAGRAKLDGFTADAGNSSRATGSTPLPGPKPIPKTGARTDAVAESTVRPGRVANASYPKEGDSTQKAPAGSESDADSPVRSYQGAALSDFLNRKKAEASETAVASRGDATSQPTSGTTPAGLAPSARTSPPPKLSAEAESFSSFLQQNPNPLNTTPKSAPTVAQNSSDAEADFAAWAEQQKSEWSRGERQAPANVPTAANKQPNAAFGVVNTIASNGPQDFGTPEFDEGEKAQPLIRQPSNLTPSSAAQSGAELVFEQPAKPAPTKEQNPFENPFDFEEHQPVATNKQTPPGTKRPAQTSSNHKSLDDSFQMDNGWKPTHLTRP